MKIKDRIFCSFFIPITKFVLFFFIKSEKIKCGKILVSIFGNEDWQEQQKKAFADSIDLLENTFPEKYLAMVYHNINRVYIGRMDDFVGEYYSLHKSMLILQYRAGLTDNGTYFASQLVRCACEIENFELPKKERSNIGRIAQLEFLSNFSGPDIDLFKDRLLNPAEPIK